jgi:hypothetical protein
MSLFKTKSTKKISVTQGGETIELEFQAFTSRELQEFKFQDKEDPENLLVICEMLSKKCLTLDENEEKRTLEDFMELELPTITQILEKINSAKNSKG